MTFLGLAIRVAGDVPYLRGVLIDAAQGHLETFEFVPTKSDDLAQQILSIADGLEGRLKVLSNPLTRVVLRTGDETQGFGKSSVMKRTRTEGAVIYVARRACAEVLVMRGPDVGRACGTDRIGVETQAKALVDSKFVVAASAALAAQDFL